VHDFCSKEARQEKIRKITSSLPELKIIDIFTPYILSFNEEYHISIINKENVLKTLN